MVGVETGRWRRMVEDIGLLDIPLLSAIYPTITT